MRGDIRLFLVGAVNDGKRMRITAPTSRTRPKPTFYSFGVPDWLGRVGYYLLSHPLLTTSLTKFLIGGG